MKVTKANMATVMGNINRFFRKEVKEYLGELNQEVGTQVIDFHGEEMIVPVYEKRPTYMPFVGECYVHPLRKAYYEKLKKGERVFTREKESAERVLLAVHDKYSACVVPICEGFDVSIKGNRMIIRDNEVMMKSVSFSGKPTYFRLKEKSTCRTFIHSEITESEMDKHIRNGIMETYGIHDQIYDCMDLIDHFGRDVFWSVSRAHQDIWQDFFDAVQSLDLNEDKAVVTLPGILSNPIYVHLNLEHLREKVSGDENDFFFMYNGEKYGDVFTFLDEEFYPQRSCDEFDDDDVFGDFDWDC